MAEELPKEKFFYSHTIWQAQIGISTHCQVQRHTCLFPKVHTQCQSALYETTLARPLRTYRAEKMHDSLTHGECSNGAILFSRSEHYNHTATHGYSVHKEEQRNEERKKKERD